MSRHSDERAALVGIGCRLPGDITTPDGLWEAITKGEPVTGPIPRRRWQEMAERLHPDQRPDTPWTAGTIDLDEFDHGFFRISEYEAATMDPQQRLLLEATVEALADAGIAPGALAGTRTGVWAGSASFDQAGIAFQPRRRIAMDTVSGTSPSILANRVSYELDLHGPSLSVDTACSAAATALYLARRSLEAGEVDTAIVTGSNIMLLPGTTGAFADAGVLAPDGICRPFDADGAGYVRSEGVVAVVLRRCGDALSDMSRVYATIRGTAANSDGRSRGLYAPNPAAHEDLLRAAYHDAGLAPGEVDWVQCHGTGTAAGDRAEARSLARILAADREEPLPIGSVKAVLGHTEGAAGLVGAVCAALALHHGQIPPTGSHTRPRQILDRLPLRVPTAVEPWPHTGRPRRAGVSAFGFGGANVHMVLEQPPEAGDPADPGPGSAAVLIPISGPTPAHLVGTAAAWAPAANAEHIGVVASTAAHRRDHHRERAAVVAADPATAVEALHALAQGAGHPALAGPRTAPHQPPRLVWVFPGHGSQQAGMGTNLHARFSAYRSAFTRAREALGDHLGRAPWSIGEPVTGFETAQHAIWLHQTAYTALLAEWGYAPDAVVGHSLGEVAAAHAAGALTLDQAAQVVAARSALLATVVGRGGLLATGLSGTAAADALAEHDPGGELVVAAVNGPSATVISGPEQPLRHLHTVLEECGVLARRVPDGVPAHSPAITPLAQRLHTELDGLAPRPTTATAFHTSAARQDIPFDRCLGGAELGAAYWAQQLRAPVDFHTALDAATAGGAAVVLEIAGRTTLAAPAALTLQETAEAVVIAAGASGRPDDQAALAQLGGLYTTGHTPAHWPAPRSRPTQLPVHWQHTTPQEAGAPARSGLPQLLAADPVDTTALAGELARLIAEATHLRPDQVTPTTRIADMGVSSIAAFGLTSRIRTAHPHLAGFDLHHLAAPAPDATATSLAHTLTGHVLRIQKALR